ncbi:MAG: hypothetical protein K2K92_07200, partial [Duncaniella sp.]|nr:hypothetical protein [Duncaniella sp.]
LPTRLHGYGSQAEVTRRMSASPLHSIEGIWQLTGESTILAVERDPLTSGPAALYRIVLISSDCLSLPPGTVVGYLTPTAVTGKYDSRLFRALSDDHTRLTSLSPFTITLSNDASSFTFSPTGSRLHFNWWRLVLPYLYHGVVTSRQGSTAPARGCLRLYPAPAVPFSPVYL